tara:strand:- start:4570 stop:4839 length:270 start_codon:yes stop_codon:yes gene_type:complete
MKFYVKLHEGVVAICDEDIVGKTFGDFKVSEAFYKGELVGLEEVKKILKEEGNFNLVGEEIVKVAVELGVLDEKSVVDVGVKHGQIYYL